MGAKSRRKKIDHRTSRAVTIPRELDKDTGNHATLAYDRIILMDPRAEIDEDDLLKFMEEYVEPAFWSWVREKEGSDDE